MQRWPPPFCNVAHLFEEAHKPSGEPPLCLKCPPLQGPLCLAENTICASDQAKWVPVEDWNPAYQIFCSSRGMLLIKLFPSKTLILLKIKQSSNVWHHFKMMMNIQDRDVLMIKIEDKECLFHHHCEMGFSVGGLRWSLTSDWELKIMQLLDKMLIVFSSGGLWNPKLNLKQWISHSVSGCCLMMNVNGVSRHCKMLNGVPRHCKMGVRWCCKASHL